MNQLDHSLQRLLKAAARAPRPAPAALPFAVEARALAQWRAGAPVDESAFVALLARRAVICASLITVLSIVWSYRDNQNAAASAVALANYELTLHLPQ